MQKKTIKKSGKKGKKEAAVSSSPVKEEESVYSVMAVSSRLLSSSCEYVAEKDLLISA